MSLSSVAFLIRISGPLAAAGAAYTLWARVANRRDRLQLKYRELVITYVTSRIVLWLVFALYMQRFVTSSDPKLYYIPMLEHFLAGHIPIRDFFYPYGPALIPSMLPFYLLARHTLAGISLFAILAEAVAIVFLLRSCALVKERGQMTDRWVTEVMALYIFNPATLYWTVFQGYHSIVQSAYSMAGLYFLLLGRATIGYAVGLGSLAGSKFLAILDWPALLVVSRPKLARLLFGGLPLLISYGLFQALTEDVLFPLRYHAMLLSEGNVWYLLTALGDLRAFYSVLPGRLLPIGAFCCFFTLGFAYWLIALRLKRTAFSLQAALGMTTFTMALFFLFSFYTGDYYVPMLMLPASVVVTCPALPRRRGVWSLLLISSLCVTGDAIWMWLGKPGVLVDTLRSHVLLKQLVAGLLTVTIVIRIACFAIIAVLGLRAAVMTPLAYHSATETKSGGDNESDEARSR